MKKIKGKFYPEIKKMVDEDEELSKMRDELMSLATFLKSKVAEVEKSMKPEQPSKNKKKAMRRKMKNKK